jgi:CcmD family protein
MSYLYAAYAATWIIHIFYLSTILTRAKRVRKEADELKRK